MIRSLHHHTPHLVLIPQPTVIVSMQALALVQQDLGGKKEELHQEVVRSIRHQTPHLASMPQPTVIVSMQAQLTVIVSMQALALVQQDLEGKKEELHQEVVRSTKYKNVHLKIQDAISEVSDCMTPAGSSRCSSSSSSAFSCVHAGPTYKHMSFAYAFERLRAT